MSELGLLLPLQSPRIAYAGQVVAVAETLMAVRQGVAAVALDIEPGPAPDVTLEDAGTRLRVVRAEVRQRLRLGAHPDGRLAAIVLGPDIAKGNAAFVEPA